ncbi:ATPase [Jannaschia pagri]|uniref:ATPase n=1 Tax=Jannaschia pagri TaxID=2829797 RepID=A0ABQ4NM68_9RHOB|nr:MULTISPECIES: ATP-binding protein [unclassified Jannaschia]GIT91665.1 ATPase [Jannaschia sp. AI_61]GIT95499.1 ATPase [Jannaschia sp. AI_62]
MDPRLNPFAPGAGTRPPAFAGRDPILEAADIALDRQIAGRHANSMILLGLRGVGKTVLLNRLHQEAKAKGYETVRLEVPDAAGGHLARMIVPMLDTVLRRLDRRRDAGARLCQAGANLANFAAAFKVSYQGFALGLDGDGLTAGSGNMEADLPDLMRAVWEAAADRGTALGLFIDEVQYLSKPELAALARTCHEAAQQGGRFLLIGAGLPQIAALAGEAKSYAERLFTYPEVGPLSPDAAREALTRPVEAEGAAFTDAALERIVADTQGYAYFLQSWGKFVWDEADASPITEDDVIRAHPAIRADLDQSFFRTRFDRCSAAEQQYLRAMAELGPGPHQTGDVARALGTESSQVANTRRKLIESGMIYSQRHGETAFTVPLFDTFMKRTMPDLVPYTPRKRA